MSMPPRSATGSGPLVAVLLILATIAVMLVVFWLAGVTPQGIWQSFFPLTPVTTQGAEIKRLYDIVFYIAVAIFLFVEGWILLTVFRYRRKPGDDTLPVQTHGNNLVEVIWTIVPTIIVGVLFVLSYNSLNAVEARSETTDVRVRAVAARFQWTFDYLDAGGATLFTQNIPQGEQGGMVVPVGVPVQVTLRSPDVIHAFYVPQFLFKRDVVPGKENIFDFTVEEAGVYRGQCAELCGAFHGSMVFEVRAIDRAAYDTWLAQQIERANATPPPAPSGGTGERVELAANTVKFDKTALEVPADAPFTLHFDNQDAGIPHNVEIKDAATSVWLGEIFNGAAVRDYAVPPIPAGEYTFVCTVHPNMTGTLTAG